MKICGFLIVFGLVSLAFAWTSAASEADTMTYEQTINYIRKQIDDHAAPLQIDPYQTGSRTYSVEDSRITVTTETGGKLGWTHKSVSTLQLAYLTGYSVNGGRLSLSVKENSRGVTTTVDHRAVNGRESREKTTSDRLDMDLDDYEVSRRVGKAIKHLADLCCKQSKASDEDPFK